MSRSIFLRPVEIIDPLNAGGFHFRYRFNAGAWHNITIPSGVYASILTVLYAIEFQLDAAGLAVAVRADVDTGTDHFFRVKFTKAGAASQDIEFDAGVIPETKLRKLFGFTSDTSSAGTNLYGDINFDNAWFPYRNPSDREGFQSDMDRAFRGSRTSQGQLVGFARPVCSTREFTFLMEPAINVLEQFCTDEYETARCVEMFFKKCRPAQVNQAPPQHMVAMNPRGFWFVPDVNCLNGIATRRMVGVTDGIHFHYSTPDRWVFLSIDPRGPRAFPVAMSGGQAYYNVDFAAHTAPSGAPDPTYIFSEEIP